MCESGSRLPQALARLRATFHQGRTAPTASTRGLRAATSTERLPMRMAESEGSTEGEGGTEGEGSTEGEGGSAPAAAAGGTLARCAGVEACDERAVMTRMHDDGGRFFWSNNPVSSAFEFEHGLGFVC